LVLPERLYYAPASEAILDELHRALPGVAWVGTVGVGVAASGIEYIDEPALVLINSGNPPALPGRQ